MARKSKWTKYFSVNGIKPGVIQHAGLGKYDLSDEFIPIGRIKELHDSGCPYLQLTEEGKKKFLIDGSVTEA